MALPAPFPGSLIGSLAGKHNDFTDASSATEINTATNDHRHDADGRFFPKSSHKAEPLQQIVILSLSSLHQRSRVRASGADSKRADFSRISGHSSSASARAVCDGAEPSFS